MDKKIQRLIDLFFDVSGNLLTTNVISKKIKRTPFGIRFWQGQKGSNPRHAVLEDSILSLFDAVLKASGDISRDILVLFHRFFYCIFRTFDLPPIMR